MRWIRRADAHERWRLRLQEYIADALDDRSRREFETHLDGCAECRAEAEELHAVRTILRAMPEVEAPRSFRLTPAMVAERPAPVPIRPRQPGWVPRAAQVAAGIAVFGFASLLAVDLLGGSGGSNDSTTTMSTAAQADDVSGEAAQSGAADATSPQETPATSRDTRDDDSGSTSVVPPTYDPNMAGGAGTTNQETATPDAEQTGPSASAYESTPTPGEGEDATIFRAESDGELQPMPDSGEFQPVGMPTEEKDDKRLIRSLEAVLASVAVGLIVLAVLARPRTKS